SSRRRHTRCYRDWSSDVCSSDLRPGYRGNSVAHASWVGATNAVATIPTQGEAMENATVNGVELEFEVTGSGEPVLLISPVLADRSEERRAGHESRSRSGT